MSKELLNAWVRLSVVLRNDRYIETMTFNEILICRLLAEQEGTIPETPYLQVKELCEKTNMLKAAINRILNSLEENNYIERLRFQSNRKNVYIKLTDKGKQYYYDEHRKILVIVNNIASKLGEQKTNELTDVLNGASNVVEELWIKNKES